jgi:hypothetical protein
VRQIPFDQLIILWDDGERRLKAAEPPERRVMEHVVDAIVLELRRRLGGPFTTAQLSELYMEGTDWCFDLAIRLAPHDPAAWDMPTVVGTAFHRYARRAMDFGGGMRRVDDEEEQRSGGQSSAG